MEWRSVRKHVEKKDKAEGGVAEEGKGSGGKEVGDEGEDAVDKGRETEADEKTVGEPRGEGEKV